MATHFASNCASHRTPEKERDVAFLAEKSQAPGVKLNLLWSVWMPAALCVGISVPAVVAADSAPGQPETSPLKEFFLAPTRIVWRTDGGLQNVESLLQPKPGQAILS